MPAPRRYLVALSGGLDSTVLLHEMASRRQEYAAGLAAIHINHGLQADGAHWAAHCESLCRGLEVPLIRVELDLKIGKGESPEAAARQARYRAIEARMEKGDMVLTAHHQDDQAETLLLQLLRGSGLGGLAAMPRIMPFGSGFLARPLLGFSRAQLTQYARDRGLSWVDDGSNLDTRYDRNYLRREVMPLLARRWPALGRTLSRSAAHCAEAQAIIDEQAGRDLEGLRQADKESLSIAGLNGLPPPRRRAVLRSWIRKQGYQVPDTARLESIEDLLTARADRVPKVHWPGAQMRRYRGRLYLMCPLPPRDPDLVLAWDKSGVLELPGGLGTLTAKEGEGGIDSERWARGKVEVRFRRGGERCRLPGRNHGHDLKKLFQEKGMPPWQRGRVPLITIDGELAAVGDLWVCEPFGMKGGASGICIQWTHRDR